MEDHPIILLLEDCPVTGLLLERIILTHLPGCRPIWTRSLEEGRVRATGVPVNIFVLDIILPDGTGLDFLWEMSALHPDARAIVLSSSTLAEHQVQAIALGALQFLEKPLNTEALISALNEAFTATGAESAFQASLRDLTPLDIIQLKCLTRATTVMEFASAGRVGRVHFRNGNIVHAEVTDAAEVAPIPSLETIFSWEKGIARELPRDQSAPQTIDTPWQSLMMQVAQAVDERA